MKNRLKRSVSVLLLFAILTTVMPLNANADTKFVTDDNNSISEHINNGVGTEDEISDDTEDSLSQYSVYKTTDDLEKKAASQDMNSLMSNGKNIRQISAANYHSKHIFLLSDGSVWAWGGPDRDYNFRQTHYTIL